MSSHLLHSEIDHQYHCESNATLTYAKCQELDATMSAIDSCAGQLSCDLLGVSKVNSQSGCAGVLKVIWTCVDFSIIKKDLVKESMNEMDNSKLRNKLNQNIAQENQNLKTENVRESKKGGKELVHISPIQDGAMLVSDLAKHSNNGQKLLNLDSEKSENLRHIIPDEKESAILLLFLVITCILLVSLMSILAVLIRRKMSVNC